MKITELSKPLQEEIKYQLGDINTVEEAVKGITVIVNEVDVNSLTKKRLYDNLGRMEQLKTLASHLDDEVARLMSETEIIRYRLNAAINSTIRATSNTTVLLGH